MQPLPQDNLLTLLKDLQLQLAESNHYVGRVGGFPIGLQIILNAETTGLLFHIRHGAPATFDRQHLTGEHLQDLIDRGEADLDVDERITWLNFFNATALVEESKIQGLLVDSLSRMKAAGISTSNDTCDECRSEPPETISFIDGRVRQTCTKCQDRQAAELVLSATNLPFILCLGALSTVVGSFCWAAQWILMELLGRLEMPIPNILLVLIYVAIGFTTAFPIAFVLKKIPRRGNVIAGWFGVAFGLAACVVGEFFFIVWLIYTTVHGFHFGAALRLFVEIIGEYPALYLIGKVIAGGLASGFAYHAVKPKIAKAIL